MRKMGIGVAGCGSTGIQSVCQHTVFPDECELVYTAAVMDPVPGRAKYVAEKFNVPKYYEDYDELLADPDVELVTLASPIGVHFEQGMKAIRAGKHVHFNKTMCLTAEEATAMIDEAAKYGVKLVSSPRPDDFPRAPPHEESNTHRRDRHTELDHRRLGRRALLALLAAQPRLRQRHGENRPHLVL